MFYSQKIGGIAMSEHLYRAKPTVWRWEDDGTKKYIIYANQQRNLILLNPVASNIYAAIQRESTVEEVANKLMEKYKNTDRTTIIQDVKAFLQHLVEVVDIDVITK